MKSTIIQYFNGATKHWYRYHRKDRKVIETRPAKDGPWKNIPITS